MTAALKKFFQPETNEEMLKRVAMILIASISVLFVTILLNKLEEVRHTKYYRFGGSVIADSPDKVVVYEFHHH